MKKAHTISQTRRYLLLGLIALCLPVVVIAIGLEIGGYLPSLIYTEPQANKHDGPSTDLDQRGKELRAALERKYQQLAADKVRIDFNGFDVTDAVLPYIPVGISFSDAETILRHARFVIEPHPDVNAPPNLNRGKEWYAVLAHISPFSRWLIFLKSDLYVVLLPRSPGDYSAVSKIRVTLHVSGP